MTHILLTGGTGALGRLLRPRLLAAGHTLTLMSRRAPAPGEDDGVRWAIGDLETGTGLAEALAGAETVIHAASHPTRRRVDVEGTARLLAAAGAAGAGHLLYISIVGIDRVPLSYYRNKLAAERLIMAAPVPWTILRATQFHELMDRVFAGLARLPLMLLPARIPIQPIAAADVADALAAAAAAGPAGRLPDIAGPEVLLADTMARRWLAATGRRRPILTLPLPGAVAAAYRAGHTTAPDRRAGRQTWAEWLAVNRGAGSGAAAARSLLA